MRVAGTLAYLHHQTGGSPLCPSCMESHETTFHITQCPEVGRQVALTTAIQALDSWRSEFNTNPYLCKAISGHLHQRGRVKWVEVMTVFPRRYWRLGVDQDELGWDSFLMGMVTKEVQHIQTLYLGISGSRMLVWQWMHKLIVHLLQITHGQWVYWNKVVHNTTSDTKWNAKERKLQKKIDLELNRGLMDLRPEDHHLMIIELEDLGSTSGEQQEYWLLAVEAACLYSCMVQFWPARIG